MCGHCLKSRASGWNAHTHTHTTYRCICVPGVQKWCIQSPAVATEQQAERGVGRTRCAKTGEPHPVLQSLSTLSFCCVSAVRCGTPFSSPDSWHWCQMILLLRCALVSVDSLLRCGNGLSSLPRLALGIECQVSVALRSNAHGVSLLRCGNGLSSRPRLALGIESRVSVALRSGRHCASTAPVGAVSRAVGTNWRGRPLCCWDHWSRQLIPVQSPMQVDDRVLQGLAGHRDLGHNLCGGCAQWSRR